MYDVLGPPPRLTALFLDGSFAGGGQAMTPRHNPITITE